MSDVAAEVRDLRMSYGPAMVLDGIDFEIRTGEVVALLGPNGAGKTTTIEILEGFRGRSSGEVTVLGTDPARGGEAWRARLGIVLQSRHDHSKWRVRELLHHLGSYYARAFSLGSLTLPGVIAMNFAMSGLMGQPAILSAEKEDGTLLRAKATPGGMTAYVTGKIVYIAAGIGLTMAMTLVLGLSAFPGVSVTAGGWLTLAWVSVLGLLATVPAGLAIGSLLPGPRLMPLFMLPFAGITAISGIFYPLTHLPGWLQAIGQVFPVYWLGLGMRAALLPGAMQAVELNRSWRLPDAGLVLLVWAVLGLAAAPPLLRRMARRESGSRVAARRERAMLRAT